MPTLPSGRILALAKHHILPPGIVGFTCPEGHFWFHQLDRKICPPPLKPGEDFLCDFVHAPCPTTREEALAILRVLERESPESDEYRWRGYVVADPEALADLTPEDRAAWDAWVAEPKTAAFLDEVIAQCREQAEANRGNPGYMVFRGRGPDRDKRGS
jgi:hypothetical protein